MAHEPRASTTTNSFPQQRTEAWEPAGDRGPTEPAAGGPVPSLYLDRLLSGAVLTPGQAVFIAVRLLDAAAEEGSVDGRRLGAVSLTASGDVEVGPADVEGTPVGELLGRVLHNARRLPAHPRPEQLQLLHSLEEAAGHPAPDPGARARELEGTLVEAVGPGYRQRLSGQLAALVGAFAQVAPGVHAAGNAARRPMTVAAPVSGQRAPWAAPASSGAPRAPRRAAPARAAAPRSARRSRALMHRRGRGVRVALVVVVVAVVLVGGGYLLLRGPGAGVVGAFGLGTQPSAPTTTAPPHRAKHQAQHQAAHRQHQQAVPALAPPHSGPVTLVTLRTPPSCKPGTQCRVRVTVHLRRSSAARTVSWKVGAARVCKPGLAWSGVTTVTAHAGWTTVFAHSSVHAPKGRSLALTALTTAPARAQSRPVPVAGSSLHC